MPGRQALQGKRDIRRLGVLANAIKQCDRIHQMRARRRYP